MVMTLPVGPGEEQHVPRILREVGHDTYEAFDRFKVSWIDPIWQVTDTVSTELEAAYDLAEAAKVIVRILSQEDMVKRWPVDVLGWMAEGRDYDRHDYTVQLADVEGHRLILGSFMAESPEEFTSKLRSTLLRCELDPGLPECRRA